MNDTLHRFVLYISNAYANSLHASYKSDAYFFTGDAIGQLYAYLTNFGPDESFDFCMKIIEAYEHHLKGLKHDMWRTQKLIADFNHNIHGG
ncbi:MAG: hypothetical protein ACR2MS_07820 [Weeksellaceae bacterium]